MIVHRKHIFSIAPGHRVGEERKQKKKNMQDEPQGSFWWQVLLQMVFAVSRNSRHRRSDFRRSGRRRLDFPKISASGNWIIPAELPIKCETFMTKPCPASWVINNALPCIINEHCHGLSCLPLAPASSQFTCTCVTCHDIFMLSHNWYFEFHVFENIFRLFCTKELCVIMLYNFYVLLHGNNFCNKWICFFSTTQEIYSQTCTYWHKCWEMITNWDI